MSGSYVPRDVVPIRESTGDGHPLNADDVTPGDCPWNMGDQRHRDIEPKIVHREAVVYDSPANVRHLKSTTEIVQESEASTAREQGENLNVTPQQVLDLWLSCVKHGSLVVRFDERGAFHFEVVK